jgi:hypothetical protein
MSLLQDGLRNGTITLESLTRDLAIKVKRHGKYPQLVQLKYDQINSIMGDPIVQECRGIILDSEDNWRIVARPFDKFFNYGEGHAKAIDWASARVQEKLDGSLIILYHYDGEWQVATSGTPDASGQVNGCGFTFAELFWRVWAEGSYELPAEHCGDRCFMFELMTQYNRVVVHHKESKVATIGIRFHGGEEVNINEGHPEAWVKEARMPPMVRSFSLGTMEEIEKTFAHIDPFDQEGYVVVDKDFNRVKVKSPAYVAIHNLRDGFGPKRIVEIVRQNEASELLTYFPEWTKAFNEVKERYQGLITQLESVYEKIKHIENQKEFALALQAETVPMSGALYMLRAKKIPDLKTYLAQVTINSLMDALAIRDLEF